MDSSLILAWLGGMVFQGVVGAVLDEWAWRRREKQRRLNEARFRKWFNANKVMP